MADVHQTLRRGLGGDVDALRCLCIGGGLATHHCKLSLARLAFPPPPQSPKSQPPAARPAPEKGRHMLMSPSQGWASSFMKREFGQIFSSWWHLAWEERLRGVSA